MCLCLGDVCIKLTWSRAVAVFEFIQPDVDDLPEFDGYAQDALNADAVNILSRIERIVPQNFDPGWLWQGLQVFIGVVLVFN